MIDKEKYIYSPPTRKSRPKVLQQFGTHVFYGEGTKTEPHYVENMKEVIKNRYKMTASDIIIVDSKSGGRNTLSLVEYAENDVEARRRMGAIIDHVWIFYDKDSFKKDNYDNAFHKIISKNKDPQSCEIGYLNDEGDHCDKHGTRWHALWSNECFELWVLLHFEFCDAGLSRTSYIPRLDELLKSKDAKLEYEKNLVNLFEILEEHGSIKNAVNWAKKLEQRLPNIHIKTNPSTGIYELIEYFKLYLKLDF